jgi:hypothetical protein
MKKIYLFEMGGYKLTRLAITSQGHELVPSIYEADAVVLYGESYKKGELGYLLLKQLIKDHPEKRFYIHGARIDSEFLDGPVLSKVCFSDSAKFIFDESFMGEKWFS